MNSGTVATGMLAGVLASTALAQGPADLPKLINAGIAGAPELGQPQLIMGKTKPVRGGQHGLAAPAVRDWDGDGLADLLIGEFETGACWIRVYRNIGTKAAPRFEDTFTYAEGRKGRNGKGERLKIDSW